MPQLVAWYIEGKAQEVTVPDPEEYVNNAIQWGRIDVLFTPAYWATQAAVNVNSNDANQQHRLGSTLTEEVVACLLGGYGIPSEVGLAAFRRVREAGYVVGEPPSEDDLYALLSEPLLVGNNLVHYRFARQKSQYLSAFLKASRTPPNVFDSHSLRDWLLRFRGIGLKTASWIVRNWLGSDNIAIIDVHLYRAGLLTGFFSRNDNVTRDYLDMEKRYLDFATAIGVRASHLDAIMWDHMRRSGRLALSALSPHA